MNIDKIDQLKDLIYQDIVKYGDKPFIILNTTTYTGNELAEEVKNETELGIKLLSDLINLSLDIASRKSLLQANDKYALLDEQLELNKTRMIEAIVNSNLTKIEKVILLTKYNLYPVESWLLHPFDKFRIKNKLYGTEFFSLQLQQQHIQKYQTVYFQDYFEYFDDYNSDTGNKLIPVIVYFKYDKNRTYTSVDITKEEFIETLCDYVLENKVIGFKCDW